MPIAINVLSGFMMTFMVNNSQHLVADQQLTKNLPKECCPTLCSTLEDGDRFVVDQGRRYFHSRRFGKVLLPENINSRQSPDGQYHICLGITDFADPVVKCVFYPPVA